MSILMEWKHAKGCVSTLSDKIQVSFSILMEWNGMERCKGLSSVTLSHCIIFLYRCLWTIKINHLEHLDLELNHFNNSILSLMERLSSLKFLYLIKMGLFLQMLMVFVIMVSFQVWLPLGCLEEERIALLLLKDSLNYPNGTSLLSWIFKRPRPL